MKIDGAVVSEQGVTFAIVIMKMFVLDSKSESESAIRSLEPIFPNMPIVLMAQTDKGTPQYCGRPDIVKFLASIDMNRIPWREYTVSEK